MRSVTLSTSFVKVLFSRQIESRKNVVVGKYMQRLLIWLAALTIFTARPFCTYLTILWFKEICYAKEKLRDKICHNKNGAQIYFINYLLKLAISLIWYLPTQHLLFELVLSCLVLLNWGVRGCKKKN